MLSPSSTSSPLLPTSSPRSAFASGSVPTAYVIGMTTVAAVIVLVVALLTGQDLSSPRGHDWPFLIFLALFPGTPRPPVDQSGPPAYPALVMSVMLLAVPVISAAGAAALLGETLNGVQLLGGAIVMGAIGTIVISSPTERAESWPRVQPKPTPRSSPLKKAGALRDGAARLLRANGNGLVGQRNPFVLRSSVRSVSKHDRRFSTD